MSRFEPMKPYDFYCCLSLQKLHTGLCVVITKHNERMGRQNKLK